MKSFFKITLLFNIITAAFHLLPTFAADFITKLSVSAVNTGSNSSLFENNDQKSSYALGASLGHYIENSLKEQEKLGINLDKDQLIAGIQGVFVNESKLSDQEIEQTLRSFEERVKISTQAKMEKDAAENEIKGKEYRDKFIKEKNVKTSFTGLAYKIEKIGDGNSPKDSDTVVVHYNGTLIDGKEFDNSYTRGQPLSFRLDGVIPGWTEGLKNIKKGGKIRLVVPPNLAYGKTSVPGIPANSTLIFDIELLDIKPVSKTGMSDEEKTSIGIRK